MISNNTTYKFKKKNVYTNKLNYEYKEEHKDIYCYNKKAYPSKSAALNAIKRMKKSKNFNENKHYTLLPYKCSNCGYWHIGSSLVKNHK